MIVLIYTTILSGCFHNDKNRNDRRNHHIGPGICPIWRKAESVASRNKDIPLRAVEITDTPVLFAPLFKFAFRLFPFCHSNACDDL